MRNEDPSLPTPMNFPELKVAAERFFEELRAIRAARLDPAVFRTSVRKAGAAYMAVFSEVARRKGPAEGNDPAAGQG
jgi:hypothetical protein